MKLDKKSLIKYDFDLYKNQYNKIQKDLDSVDMDNDEKLSKEDLKKWLYSGVFVRRLNVRGIDGNIYVTSASIKRGGGSIPDLRFGKNDYLYSVWSGDKKVHNLLKRYIGDHEEEVRLKPLDLIGEYDPFEDNLLNVRYETIAGKEYIENASNFLSGKEFLENENERIDIKDFFRLKFEMAEQGLQARALYDENNCIIDGSAGTGKSTIAIQKLKYFYEHGVSQDKLLLIVRNHFLKNHFMTLLKDKIINLSKVQIKTIDEIFDIYQINNLELVTIKAKEIEKEINSLIQKRDIETLEKHYYHLFNHIGLDFFKNKILIMLDELKQVKYLEEVVRLNIEKDQKNKEYNNYLSEQKEYIDDLKKTLFFLRDKRKKSDEDKEEYNLIKEEIENYEIRISEHKKGINKIQNKIDKLTGKQYKKFFKSLTVDSILPISILDDLIYMSQNKKEAEDLEILKWFFEYKNYLINNEKNQEKLDNLKNKLQTKISSVEKNKIKNDIENLKKELSKKYKNVSRQYFDKYTNMMKKVYFSKKYLKNTYSIDNDLIYKLLDIEKKEFDTIIVDEAQDFSKDEIEYIRLHTDRIILTGDILQNIENNIGLKKWTDIHNTNYYENENGQLNIHSLKHNFRQTYQLANASYNYRQLLLNDKIEDIGFDYYENEKIFNGKEYPKPTLSIFLKDIDLIDYIDNKVKHIIENYTERIPIVIVYKTEKEKKFYADIFSDYEVAYKKIDTHADIILLNLNDIKGEEFPIVLSNMNSFRERELYLIMTRAQFELDFFIKHYNDFNPLIYKLIYNEEQIRFFNLINIDISQIKLVDKQIFKEKEFFIAQSSQNSEYQENFIEVEETIIKSNNKQHNIITTKEQIKKHKAETTQYDEELDMDLITNEDEYQEKFIEKVQKDIEQLDIKKQNEVIEEIIVVRKKSTSKKDKELKSKIKNYLYDTYKGYCQVCGFTFRKVSDGKNYFEIFNWNDKRVVKQKKNFVTTADSLCLCRNCSANIKWGAFEPIFMDRINNIENFANQSLDYIKEKMCVNIEIHIVDKFKDYYEWNDIFALEIKVNNEYKHIYITNEHLIQFISYLKLEETIDVK